MSVSNTEVPQNKDFDFWDGKWRANDIGFHRLVVNSYFQKNVLSKLTTNEQQQCVFFPLCGKTVDMKAVLDSNNQVIGVECSTLGIEAFFQENNIEYTVITDKYKTYKGNNLPVTIYCADFFTFNPSLPTIDYIWDRGGLVAINPANRAEYRDTLLRLMTPGHTKLYIVAMYYNEPGFTGPPNCLSDEDIAQLFGSTCSIELIEIADITDDFNKHNKRAISRMEEHVHLIIKK